jgi:hypothetical protein
VGVYILYQYELLTSYSHNHRGWWILIQGNDFIYKKRVIVFIKVQHVICFIEHIKRSKSYANYGGDAFNASIGYPFKVEAVYLPGQRSYLLKQGNAGIRIITSLFRALIGLVHT